MDDVAIGIDLGTTNSCVALFINGHTKILENSDGGRITPSFVFFTSLDETIVGEHAKRMAESKPTHGIYEVKRFVGRHFTDRFIQNNLQYLPFKVEADNVNDPLIIIEQRNKILSKSPQSLYTVILQKLKTDVEAKLGHPISKVVITVPAYFNVTQRKVTLAAAKEAGFHVLKLLNEPTAAALSYYFENDCNETNYSLVYDLGGGTFDVAVLKKSRDNIEILGVDGDTQLGGHDFDNLIVNYICEQLMKDYKYDAKSDKDNLRRLHNKCEDAKKALSTVPETVVTLIGFVPNHNCVRITLTREEFENIADDLFKKTIDIVDNCLKTSNVSKSAIKEIILSGGSTRIPKIQNLLSVYFGGKNLNKFVHPDECVAEGAALQAAMLSKNSKQTLRKIRMIDVIPLSLGTEILGGRMSFLIKRNSRLPTSGTSVYQTVNNQQESIGFNIFEGERLEATKNRLLGKMLITDLTPAPPGLSKVTFTMNVDANGILTVIAQEEYKNNIKQLTVEYNRGDKSETEIKNSLLDAQQNEEKDIRFMVFAKRKAYLLSYCISVMYNLDIKNLKNTHSRIYELCKATKQTLHEMYLEDINTVNELVKEIKLECEPIVKQYNFLLMPQME